MIRAARLADTPTLLAVACATGLFAPAEASALLGGVLDALHADHLGPGHAAQVWSPNDAGAPSGWVYHAPDAHADGVWNLWWIGVHPEDHGRGGGDSLLDAVEAAVMAEAGRELVVEKSALPPLARARAFYARRGYIACGRVPDFYGVGDDKIIFAKRMCA
ncbi:GNAT family N-acetyltransferase [Gemmatimonas groenlandica]|uniref:GNAT family N-acetyltransferase n=1 Tax=Gemmatimonas groenlandica TaxID=2732249 RepID=A0A6M4IV15_9BACT|nr:GNAT family N-acetyltransferase [Gemmatimonas groenlandica]QJR37599.1 GNAT family N-acetyltransferase [Gemmatimonas groenlandica]